MLDTHPQEIFGRTTIISESMVQTCSFLNSVSSLCCVCNVPIQIALAGKSCYYVHSCCYCFHPMTARFASLFPILAEWSGLGGFVFLGDLAAQSIEYAYTPTRCWQPNMDIARIEKRSQQMSLHKTTDVNETMHCTSEKISHPSPVTSISVTPATTLTSHFIESNAESFQADTTRLIAAACTGLLFIAPICMIWFPFLHRLMARRFTHLAEGSFRYVSTKVILENVILAGPICLGYFVIPAMIEGGGEWYSLLTSRLKSDFAATFSTDVSFWCVVSPFNYKFIPVR